MRRHCKPLEMILKKTTERHAKYTKAVLTPLNLEQKYANSSYLLILESWRYLLTDTFVQRILKEYERSDVSERKEYLFYDLNSERETSVTRS